MKEPAFTYMQSNGRFCVFELVGRKPKTNVYVVKSAKNGEDLGIVEWYAPWRQYCFSPIDDAECVFSTKCLQNIVSFIADLMKERTEEKKKVVSSMKQEASQLVER